jgi:anti-sigma factor RsiW
MRNKCPNEETLVDYLERRLPGRQQTRVESHLVACSNCREQVGLYLQLMDQDKQIPSVNAPASLTDKTVKLVADSAVEQRSGSLLRGARRWVAKGVALLEQLTPSNGPQSVAVRSTETVLSERRISRQKQFKDLTVTIEIERSSDDHALIRVIGAEQPAMDLPVRVALFIDDREIASMMLMDAPLVFDDIAFGAYSLVFIRKSVKVGEYRFEITADTDDMH